MQEVAHLLPTHIYTTTAAHLLPTHIYLHDEMVPLRTLDLSADHESIITSNDVLVDHCVLEPTAVLQNLPRSLRRESIPTVEFKGPTRSCASNSGANDVSRALLIA